MIYRVEILEPDDGWVIWEECETYEEAEAEVSWARSFIECLDSDEVRIVCVDSNRNDDV